jgi:hypothetical protein
MPPKKKKEEAGGSKSKGDLIKERDMCMEKSKELAAASEASGGVVADLGRGKATMVMRLVELEVALSELQLQNKRVLQLREDALKLRIEAVAQVQQAKDAITEDSARTLAAGRDVREEVKVALGLFESVVAPLPPNDAPRGLTLGRLPRRWRNFARR